MLWRCSVPSRVPRHGAKTFVNERAVPGTGLVLPRARGTRHVQAQHMQPAKTCAGTLRVPLPPCCPVALEGRGKALRHARILFFRFEALEKVTCNFEPLGFITFAFEPNTLKRLKPPRRSRSQPQVNGIDKPDF